MSSFSLQISELCFPLAFLSTFSILPLLFLIFFSLIDWESSSPFFCLCKSAAVLGSAVSELYVWVLMYFFMNTATLIAMCQGTWLFYLLLSLCLNLLCFWQWFICSCWIYSQLYCIWLWTALFLCWCLISILRGSSFIFLVSWCKDCDFCWCLLYSTFWHMAERMCMSLVPESWQGGSTQSWVCHLVHFRSLSCVALLRKKGL